MAEASDTSQILYQNLIDAGCDQQTIKQCMTLIQKDPQQVISLLQKHRDSLRTAVHDGQKQIDCLDFLIYQIKKEII